ncbi:hypothetical protein D1AOALGA4SA_6503 [Olavius algarvensis Delta 1 endosymbiont]|nr:hypothetical protein D1AOALGA4SA_6503 [Olavius algarvensis Delta 1 endosymbiont]
MLDKQNDTFCGVDKDRASSNQYRASASGGMVLLKKLKGGLFIWSQKTWSSGPGQSQSAMP